jgi:hypothetical protein
MVRIDLKDRRGEILAYRAEVAFAKFALSANLA